MWVVNCSTIAMKSQEFKIKDSGDTSLPQANPYPPMLLVGKSEHIVLPSFSNTMLCYPLLGPLQHPWKVSCSFKINQGPDLYWMSISLTSMNLH